MKEAQRKLPQTFLSSIKPYLHKDEKILDALKEVWVPRIDFTWLILTDVRVIVATRSLFQFKFTDYILSGLDIDMTIGFPFDTLTLEVFSKKYTGQFYWFSRKKTLGFIEKLESTIEANEKMEERGNKIPEKKGEKCEPLETLKRLADLQKQGIITKEEFEKKKKKLLEDI